MRFAPIAILLIACASEPRERPTVRVERVELGEATTEIASAEAPVSAEASVSAAPPVTSSHATKKLTAITGPTVQEGDSRVGECKAETLARDLYAPAWLFAGKDGKVYAIESDSIKRKGKYDHRARIYDLSGSKARLIADVAARPADAALVGDEIVLSDTDELVRVPLASGKRVADGAPPNGIASRGDELVRAEVLPERIELRAASGPVAILAGRWGSNVTMAFSDTHSYFYVFPHVDDDGATASVIAGRLARAPFGGEAELLGSVHTAGSLAAGGGFVFAGSLTSMLRMNERTGEWQRAPNWGAENIVADARAAAWTDADGGNVMFWPHGARPFLACSGLPGVVAIAMNDKHVYFSTYGADVTAGGATLGRFARPR